MSGSAAAFANFPSEARGILLADTYDPISLHTADLHVLFSGYAAQVTLSLEYVNETNRLVKAIAAYPLPPGFHLQHTTLTGPNRSLTNNVYQQSRALRSVDGGNGLPAKSLYDIMTSAVATQTVPWDLSPGDSVLMTSVYHAPLALIQRQSEIAFAMPTSLFPAVVRPPEAQRNYVKASSDATSNRRVGKAGGLYVTVEGQLYRPLRGNVTLDKGGFVVPPEEAAQLNVVYHGDSGFRLTYQDTLPTKPYTQQALTVRAPVGDVIEPLRLHTVTVAPTATTAGAAAVALTMAPNFANCPVNAELVFLIDVHTAEMAVEVAEAVAAALTPSASTLPASVYANVVICNDTRRHGCVALFPTGSVPVSTIPNASVLAYMKEEIAVTTSKSKKGTLAPAAVYSPQLPAVLHDALAGRNVSTAVPDGYVRNIILLSDAGGLAKPSESAAMICDAASFATNTRVHCVALGPAADRATLETLALRAGGRYRSLAPVTGIVPSNKKAPSPLLLVLREVLVAAVVPCLANVRTLWKLVLKGRSKSAGGPPLGVVRLAADASGTGLPCIPRNTRRVLFGLISPPPRDAANAVAATEDGAGQANGGLDDGGAAATPLQLNVRVVGRVGNLSLEFTAAALITRLTDVVPAAAASPTAPQDAAAALPSTTDTAAPTGGEIVEASMEPPQPMQLASITPQESPSLISPERDNASAGSVSRNTASVSANSPAGSPVKRNGKTLLLHTAAAAARIAYLSDDQHALTPAEVQEMLELSRGCMLPSPYTTLTDGKAPLTAEQKRGGVVFMPSVVAKAQAALAIRTRQAEAAAVAPSAADNASGNEKNEKGSEKDKKKGEKKGNKDTLSLYSAR